MVPKIIEPCILEFNHYPNIVQRKEPYGPVCKYRYKEHWFQIELMQRIYANKKEFVWIVTGYVHRRHIYKESCKTIEESLAYIEKWIQANRIRILF